MKKYGSLIMIVAIFFVVTKVFQPTDPATTGMMIFKALGVAAATIVGIVLIFLYVKSGLYPKWGNLPSVTPATMAVLGTTALFTLFLLTVSYSFGGSWMRWNSVLWMWSSGMFLPSLLAIGGMVVFANSKWRKRINDGLIFLIGAFIATTFAVNAFMGWWEGKNIATPDTANTPAPSIPQQVVVATPEPPKPREESVEREVEREDTIIAEYGVFTPVDIPPAAKIVDFRYGRNVPEWCVMGVVHEGAPGGEKVPCSNPEGKTFRGITKIGFASDMPGDQIVVPVKYKYIPAT